MDWRKSCGPIPQQNQASPSTFRRNTAQHEALFAHLNDFTTVWVVGPQRAGTRVTSYMAAADLKVKRVDETDFHVDSLSHLSAVLRRNQVKKVIQGPGITRWIHRLAGPNDAVIMMIRSLADIHASETRISWQYDHVEAMKYGRRCGSAEAKYSFWDRYQKSALAHPFEVQYSELEGHPLWVPKRERADFSWNQTVIN